MFTEGIYPIGDGLLDIEEKRLKGLLVPDDINEIYEVEQTPFARGKFAAVRRAIHKNSGVHYAAKFLKRRRRAQSSDKEIKHEIAVLMLCEGEDNIVRLNAVHETRSDTALLLELATGGELQTILDNEECLTEAQARICMRAVLKALQFLHKRSIAHLDLKPQNILLNGERVEDGLKLCDFGISRVVAEGTNVREIVGTPDYVAPEVLQYEPLSLMTDIWSVGVLAYVLLSGFSPFGGETKQETFLNISQCALTFPEKLFGGVSSAAIDFIRKALRIKPNERMTAAGCLEHHWLKDECSLDRQIFSKQHNINVNDLDVEAEDEDEDDVEDEENDDDEEEEEDDEDADVERNEENSEELEEVELEEEVQDISIDEVEEEPKQLASLDKNSTTNLYNKMESSDLEGDLENKKNKSKSYTNGSTSTKTSSTTIKATGVLTLPPCSRSTSATTTIPIPIFNLKNNEEPQKSRVCGGAAVAEQIHLSAARRQPSDSNKENTFLSIKKIPTSPCNGSANGMKPTTPTTPITSLTTSTATILIGSPQTSKDLKDSLHGSGGGPTPAVLVTNGGSIVATITLPNSTADKLQKSSNSSGSAVQQCVFPDAPTTPKVIRKAPTTDTSPTSVKALVKKFQLEEGNKQQHLQMNGEKHLKENNLNQQSNQLMNGHHHLHQHQHHQNTPPPHQLQHPSLHHANTNGYGYGNRRPSGGGLGAIGGVANSEKASSQNSLKIQNNSNNNNTLNMNNNNSNSNSSKGVNITRRASEPITAIHKKSTTVTVAPRHSVASTSAGCYKSTCVFGLSCHGRTANNQTIVTTTLTQQPTSIMNNECRHSSTNGCSSPSSSSASSISTKTSTISMRDDGSSNVSPSASTTTATALLLNSSHQYQHKHHLNHHQPQHHHHPHHPHHHHHHHGVAKTATNNLTMDQGIIC